MIKLSKITVEIRKKMFPLTYALLFITILTTITINYY
jgi:hypothetical protein